MPKKSIYNYEKLAGQPSDILPVYQPIPCASSISIVNVSKHAVISLQHILWHGETAKVKAVLIDLTGQRKLSREVRAQFLK